MESHYILQVRSAGVQDQTLVASRSIQGVPSIAGARAWPELCETETSVTAEPGIQAYTLQSFAFQCQRQQPVILTGTTAHRAET